MSHRTKTKKPAIKLTTGQDGKSLPAPVVDDDNVQQNPTSKPTHVNKSGSARPTKKDNEIRKSSWAWGWDAVTAIFAVVASVVALWTYQSAVDTAQKQLRAYVGVESISVDLPSSKVDNYKPMSVILGTEVHDLVILNIKNSGATPASDVDVWLNWEPMPYGHQLPTDFKFENYSSEVKEPYDLLRSTYALFPNANRETTVVIQNAKPFLEALQRQKSLYLYGEVKYSDIYNRAHRTEFCYAYQVLTNGQVKIFPCTKHQAVD